MAGWSQSHFLQSLGWATLNSFWQMALLWCIFQAARHFFNLSSSRKYQLSVLAVFSGFAWFAGSFLYYFNTGTTTAVSLFDHKIQHTDSLLNILLTSASIAYLVLLVIPAWRLFRNWQFVKKIQSEGLSKASLDYRLFIQKVAAQIGITRKVRLYLSELVNSPLTVGYLKPVILLPVAALNNLTPQQVEAVLLHELSHIRRYDYLVNLMVSIIHTVLYFNPFVRLFLKNIEAERENCCDELVLQFGYDKVDYASALLLLEKASSRHQVLTLAATGKTYLLARIEKIIGMEKKEPRMKMNHLAGWIAALLCVVAFNSVLIIREEKSRKSKNDSLMAYDQLSNPFNFFRNSPEKSREVPEQTVEGHPSNVAFVSQTAPLVEMDASEVDADAGLMKERENEEVSIPGFMLASLNESEIALTQDQKEQVRSTLNGTRKILAGQWSKVEEAMADAMTAEEKAIAHQQYLKELEQMDWKVMENSMKSAFTTIDWNGLNAEMAQSLTKIRLDSVEKTYNIILQELNKADKELTALTKAKVSCTPIPDGSLNDIRKAREEIARQVDSVKALKKQVVKL
jgi:bla regulator protein BlaR1